MTDVLEIVICNADGCAVDAGSVADAGPISKTKTLNVEIVSDAICPWCYVARRQFERAVARLPEDVKLSVYWKPFELNPNMPPEGLDRVGYRSRKFGSWEYSQKLDAQVTAATAQVGLTMRRDLMQRTPNTLNTHRLVWFADKEGVQDVVV